MQHSALNVCDVDLFNQAVVGLQMYLQAAAPAAEGSEPNAANAKGSTQRALGQVHQRSRICLVLSWSFE